jgi:coenzyme PQQ precursor peptide PqqA
MPDRTVSEFPSRSKAGQASASVVRSGMSSSEVGSLTPSLRPGKASPSLPRGAKLAPAYTWEKEMAWKTPKIVEVPVGMEINMYACAARK